MDIHHVGISVADLDRAMIFYKDIMGFNVKMNKTFESMIPGRGKVTCVFLGDDNGNQMEIIYEHARAGRQYGPGERHPHVCIKVDDLEKKIDDIKRKGAKVIVQPTKPLFRDDVVLNAFIEDPEGFRIELYEMKKMG